MNITHIGSAYDEHGVVHRMLGSISWEANRVRPVRWCDQGNVGIQWETFQKGDALLVTCIWCAVAPRGALLPTVPF